MGVSTVVASPRWVRDGASRFVVAFLAIFAALLLACTQRAAADTALFGFNEGYAQRLPETVDAERELAASRAALEHEGDRERRQAAARRAFGAAAALEQAQVRQNAELRSVIADSSAAGAKVARYAIVWPIAEPQPGRFNWAYYDFVYRQLLAHGIRPLPILIDSPDWARPSRPRVGAFSAWYPDRQFDLEWERFASSVAERYPESVAIEVWNEPNSAHFWGGAPDPRRYAELLQGAHDGIKRVAPSMPVLLAGPAPRIDHRFQWDRFLRRAYAHGAARASDDLSLHPYAIERGPELVQVLDQVKRAQALVHRRHPGARIWITEIGFSTHPQAENRVSELRQAALLANLHRRLHQDVHAVLIHRLREAETEDPTENGYGVTRIDGQRKPGFCALVVLHFSNRFC
jgi:hypothetical protein